MATVLTRLFPNTPGRFLGRQQREREVVEVNSDAHRENSSIEITQRERYERGEPRRKKAKVESDVDEEVESEAEESEDEAVAEVVDDDEEVSRSSRTIRLRNPRRRAGLGVEVRRTRGRARVEKSDEEDERDEGQSGTDGSSASSESESNAGVQWEAQSDAVEEAEVEIANPNRCIFCGEDEEHDPSEDFEEYLACAACGDNAHTQCAKDAKSLSSDDDNEHWRCPGCVENGIEAEKSRPDSSSRRRSKSSVPKMARDLLPAARGTIKPGSHSVFNTLILDDEPLDGTRSLRKRKSSDESEGKARPEPRKRRRRSTSEVDPLMTEITTPVDGKLECVEEIVEGMSTEQAADASPRSRGARTRPQRRMDRPLCRVLVHGEDQLVVAFCVDPAKLANLDNERRKRRRRERDRARRARRAEQAEPEVPVSHYPAIQTTSFVTPFYAFHDREGDESKAKPYGGILSEFEADTSKTFPQAADRKMFEDARQKAEEAWKKKMEAAAQSDHTRTISKVSGPPSKIKCINFGKYEIDTWHAAPYPEEYSRNKVLYICEFCLKYMSSDFVAWRHKLKCPAKHPPGDEIYRDGNFSFFEVDGRKNPVYCQNLCLLAKLFLGSKTLYYDVEPFLFYIMTEHDEFGEHFVGYFSKEKRPSSLNNVSCILVLPIHQRRGFGHMLIDFSYLLTKVEKKTGSPEKPLSDMGLVSYRSYWRLVLCHELLNQKTPLSITDLSDRTGMTADDIVCALEGLRALVRDPVTKTYALRLDYAYFRQYIENYEKKGYTQIRADALFWVPYVMGRDNMHYEGVPHISTVAQRADITDDVVPEEGVQMDINAEILKQQGAKEEGGKIIDDPTIKDDGDKIMLDAPATPHSSFNSGPNSISPMKKSAAKPISSIASNQATSSPGTTIPPVRFEVFPPLPGTSARRVGRPFGRRVPSRRGTPVRRGLSQGETSTPRPPTSSKLSSARRTRSNLADAVINGASDGDDSDESEDASGRRDTITEEQGEETGTPDMQAEDDVVMEEG